MRNAALSQTIPCGHRVGQRGMTSRVIPRGTPLWTASHSSFLRPPGGSTRCNLKGSPLTCEYDTCKRQSRPEYGRGSQANVLRCSLFARTQTVQGSVAFHTRNRGTSLIRKRPPPLGPEPRHRPTVGSCRGAVSCERRTPVTRAVIPCGGVWHCACPRLSDCCARYNGAFLSKKATFRVSNMCHVHLCVFISR